MGSSDSSRGEADARWRASARAFRALRRATHALIHASDEHELLESLCRAAVEEAGYLMSWIGYAETDGTVRPVAQAGFEEGYLRWIGIRWDGGILAEGPTGTAIRERRAVVFQDTAEDPRFAPWREDALRRGYASSAAIPLLHGEACLGALNLYAAEPKAFPADELGLLHDLAADVVLGLTQLRERAENARSRRAAHRADTRYRALFENASDPIWLAILDAPRLPFRLAEANPALCALVGRSRAELEQEAPEQLLADEAAAELAARGRVRYETAITSVDGVEIPIEIEAHLFELDGRPVALSIGRDLRERRRAEAERARLQEQVARAQRFDALGRLSQAVAHDVNNLLGIVSLSAEAIRHHVPAGTPPAIEAEEIVATVRRGSALVRELLTFARVRPSDRGARAGVDRTIEAARTLLERLAGAQVSVDLALGAGPAEVVTSASQLEQILANLVVNARDAMSGTGTIRIATALEERSAGDGAPAAPWVSISVADHGTGIAPDVLPLVFEPFFTTKGEAGTGLGLATVWGITMQAGGDVSIESELHRGTTITVRLPVQVGSDQTSSSKVGVGSGGGGIGTVPNTRR